MKLDWNYVQWKKFGISCVTFWGSLGTELVTPQITLWMVPIILTLVVSENIPLIIGYLVDISDTHHKQLIRFHFICVLCFIDLVPSYRMSEAIQVFQFILQHFLVLWCTLWVFIFFSNSEYVRNLNQICMYNCRRKNEFIKKGLGKFNLR
jgi:hypothetical protein